MLARALRPLGALGPATLARRGLSAAAQLPATMRAVVAREPNAAMRVEELPLPTPGAGEVLVRTHATGVCHTDLHVLKAEVPFPFPCVLGHEMSGTVAALGAGADRQGLEVGDAVVGSFIMPCGECRFCVRGQEDLCEQFFALNRLRGVLYDGTTRLRFPDGDPIAMYSMAALAEYCVLPATAAFKIPDGVPFAEASIVGCAVFTAYGAVRNAADLRAGESVAVVGAGGVGANVLQIARAFGAAPIIAVDVADDKLEACKALGATHTVNALNANPTEAIREITGGRGVDVAIECLGRPLTFRQTVESVSDGGRAVCVGIAPAGVLGEVDITRLVRRQIRVIGSYGARARTDVPATLELIRNGQIDVVSPITRRYSLDEANDAYAALDRGEIVGRAIVEM